MPQKKLKSIFSEMLLSKKLLLIGSLALAISCFLPWYSDIDRFNTGSTYLGVSGPLYLAGLIVFLSASASIFVLTSEAIGHKINKFPLSTQQIHVSAISISILMILLASSAFFHPKFGINITNKQVGIGLITGIISLITMTSGIFLAFKKKLDKHDLMERHHESLKSIGLEKNETTPMISDDIDSERFSYFSNEINTKNK